MYSKEVERQPGTAFINPEKIAFDVDGVFADIVHTFLCVAHTRYGLTHIKRQHITNFDLSKCLQLEPSLITEMICIALDDHHTLKTRAYPDASKVLTEISNAAPLRFVTARVWGESIEKWILNQLPSVDAMKIQVFATGDPDKKLDILKNRGIEFFVEDRLETCHALLEGGIEPIIFNQPWNQGSNKYLRVSTWMELRRLIDLQTV